MKYLLILLLISTSVAETSLFDLKVKVVKEEVTTTTGKVIPAGSRIILEKHWEAFIVRSSAIQAKLIANEKTIRTLLTERSVIEGYAKKEEYYNKLALDLKIERLDFEKEKVKQLRRRSRGLRHELRLTKILSTLVTVGSFLR